jgi:hypothetical protein
MTGVFPDEFKNEQLYYAKCNMFTILIEEV